MNDVTADADQLHTTSGRYQTVADQVWSIFQTLTSRLDAEGDCWGNDGSGQVFGKKYVPSAMTVLQQMDSTNEGIQSMVDGICSWAKNYMDAGSAATADAQQLANQVAGGGYHGSSAYGSSDGYGGSGNSGNSDGSGSGG